jgi:hypothetical protein
MAQTQVIEGTTEEITALLQTGAFAGQKLRVTVETEEEDLIDTLPDPPNSIRDNAHLEQLLLDGLNSGPAAPMPETEWEDIRREVHARTARRQGTPLRNA